MLSCLNKVKAILTGHVEHKEKNNAEQSPLPKPQPTYYRAVIPTCFTRGPATAYSSSVKLQTRFCKNCSQTPDLLAVKGTLCLLGCDKIGCEKRLLRIETKTEN